MDPIISTAMDKGQKALSEYESKLLIERAGVPIAKQGLAISKEEAISIAQDMGYPVVMKGCSAALTHKSELGLIKLNINDDTEASAAYDELMATGIEMDGVLVLEMISGDREFVAGLGRDPQFGPYVMFGLGGIFTEALNDVSFRIAPLRAFDANEMMDEIKAHKLLDTFRGKPAVDREALVDILTNVGRMGMESTEIGEIDINPLIIRDGKPVAVDALIVLDTGSQG